MKNFRFKFAALRKFRENRRDLCRQLLAQLFADDTRLIDEKSKLEQTRLSQLEELRQLAFQGPVDVDRVSARRYHAGQLVGEMRVADHQRSLLAKQIELCRTALAKADQDVRILEKLEERQRAEFRNEQERREQLELHDVWLAAHCGEFVR